ncbi:hypothetical protein JCM15765_27790 [Paradesulfitobacterium aromaticivorans]
MQKKKGYKKLTNTQKKVRKQIREELREDGILPPVKPKLNRRKFAEEVIAEFEGTFGAYTDIQYLYRAISCMKPPAGTKKKISPEEIGVLKLLKIAMELKKFFEEKIRNGEAKYNVVDLYEKVVKPIIDL